MLYIPEVKKHKRQLSDSIVAVQKSGRLDLIDIVNGGAPPGTSFGSRLEEVEGRVRSSETIPEAAATEYEAIRRLK